MEAKLAPLFRILKIQPKNIGLYVEALTHKTFTNENKAFRSYEKLEFLGDAILQFKASLYIFRRFPDVDEGIMSSIRANNVSTKALAKIIKEHHINDFIICSNNQAELKGNDKICSDLFESLVAAIFLDLGEAAVTRFLTRFLLTQINKTSIKAEHLKDPKTRLQELLQPITKQPITYKTELINDTWMAKAICNHIIYGQATGKSKTEAIWNAAADALNKHQGAKDNKVIPHSKTTPKP